MAVGRIVLPPYFPARDRNAKLVSGAKLTVYQNRTTTLAAIYSTAAMNTPLQNPVPANASGQFPAIFAEAGTVETPTLYSLAVNAADGTSIGNPSVFDDWQPSVDGNVALAALADAAEQASMQNAIIAQQAVADIILLETGDVTPVTDRALRTGANITDPTTFRGNIGAVDGEGNGVIEPQSFRASLNTFDAKPEDYGPAGTGGDDQFELNQAITDTGKVGILTLPPKTYNVTSLVQPSAVQIEGKAIIQAAMDGGFEQLNTYALDRKLFFGKNHLYRLFQRIKTLGTLSVLIVGPSVAARGASAFTASITGNTLTVSDPGVSTITKGSIILAAAGPNAVLQCTVTGNGSPGDGGAGTYPIDGVAQTVTSRTMVLSNGGGYAGVAAEPQNVLVDYFQRLGVPNNPISVLNRAIGSTVMNQMDPAFDITRLGGSLDLIIWDGAGINEAALSGGDIEYLYDMARASFESIRTTPYGDWKQCALFVIGPNGTYAPAGGHSSQWYEKQRGMWEALSREYKFAFFDTYAFMKDVAPYVNTADALDSLGIHFGESFQAMKLGGAFTHMLNQADMVLYDSREAVPLTLQNGWTANAGSLYAAPTITKDADGLMRIEGMDITGGTAIAANDVIASTPSGYESVNIQRFLCATNTPGLIANVIWNQNTIYLAETLANNNGLSLSSLTARSR